MKKFTKIFVAIMLLVFMLSMMVACTPVNPDNGGGNGGNGDDDYYALDVYGINDLHGKFEDSDAQPGIDEMTTYLKKMAAEQNTIFLSSGDMWQGSCESGLTKGNIITDWMNELNFASMTLGNHEFDWGVGPIASNIQIAEFPILAINVYDVETNQRLAGCEASTVVDKGDVQIGIIGAIGDCYSSIAADKRSSVYFKVDDDLTDLIEEESARLRQEEGVDFVILSLHDGAELSSTSEKVITSQKLQSYYDPALSSGAVDLVFEGHTHQHYILRDSYGVYHLQGGGDNDFGLSHAQILFNLKDGTARVRTANLIMSTVYKNMADDPIVATLMAKYDDVLGTMNNPLGVNSIYQDGDDLSNLAAQLYYNAGYEKWGSQYDIVLGGGDINVRSPKKLYSGNVTYAMLYMLFPFDNEIVLCSIKGRDLKSRYFENGEYFIYVSTYGEKVRQNIDVNRVYYIITDTWNSGYDDNKLTVIDYLGEGVYARDLLAGYIQQGGLE